MSGNAKDVENYKIDGKALPAGTTAEFVGSKQIVKISLPKIISQKLKMLNLQLAQTY